MNRSYQLSSSHFNKGTQQGANSVYLAVRPSNIPAVELYEELGFKEIGRRPKYYTNSKEDALMMMKTGKISNKIKSQLFGICYLEFFITETRTLIRLRRKTLGF